MITSKDKMKQIVIDRYNKNGILLFGGYWSKILHRYQFGLADNEESFITHAFMYLPSKISGALSSRGICDHFKR